MKVRCQSSWIDRKRFKHLTYPLNCHYLIPRTVTVPKRRVLQVTEKESSSTLPKDTTYMVLSTI